MNKTDAKKIIASMIAIYPNYRPVDIIAVEKAWTDVMPEYSYEQVNAALNSYIRSNTSGFAPAPGQLIEIIHTMTRPEKLNEMEAWTLVRTAIGRSTYYSTEEFSKLPPLVQKAVGDSNQLRTWAMDENFNESVVMANFQRTYRIVISREKEISKMPENVRKLIQKTCKQSPAEMLEQKRKKTIEQVNIIALPGKIYDGVPMPEKYKGILKKLKEGYCDGSIPGSIKG